MTRARLLAVEDDSRIADLIHYVAEEAGFEVCRARRSESFHATYNRFRPNVIVLDILMPEMDGFEVLRFLGERQSNASIIILSGEDSYRQMAGKLADGLGLRIEANVGKPFRVNQLREALAGLALSTRTAAALPA